MQEPINLVKTVQIVVTFDVKVPVGTNAGTNFLNEIESYIVCQDCKRERKYPVSDPCVWLKEEYDYTVIAECSLDDLNSIRGTDY